MVIGHAFAVEIAGFSAVVEGLSGDVRHVAEAIPLCAGLRVHGVEVVVGYVFVQGFDGVLECFAAEGWLEWDVEREVETGHFAGLDLCCGGFDAGWGEEVEAADVVVFAPDPGCVFGGAGDAWEVFAGGKGGGVGVEGNGGGGFAHDCFFDLSEAACCFGEGVCHVEREVLCVSGDVFDFVVRRPRRVSSTFDLLLFEV